MYIYVPDDGMGIKLLQTSLLGYPEQKRNCHIVVVDCYFKCYTLKLATKAVDFTVMLVFEFYLCLSGRTEAVQAGDQGEYRRRARNGPSAHHLYPTGLKTFFVNLAVLLLNITITYEYILLIVS